MATAIFTFLGLIISSIGQESGKHLVNWLVTPEGPPAIVSVTPLQASPGDEITIQGMRLGSRPASLELLRGKTRELVQTTVCKTSDQHAALLPSNLEPGEYKVRLIRNGVPSVEATSTLLVSPARIAIAFLGIEAPASDTILVDAAKSVESAMTLKIDELDGDWRLRAFPEGGVRELHLQIEESSQVADVVIFGSLSRVSSKELELNLTYKPGRRRKMVQGEIALPKPLLLRLAIGESVDSPSIARDCAADIRLVLQTIPHDIGTKIVRYFESRAKHFEAETTAYDNYKNSLFDAYASANRRGEELAKSELDSALAKADKIGSQEYRLLRELSPDRKRETLIALFFDDGKKWLARYGLDQAWVPTQLRFALFDAADQDLEQTILKLGKKLVNEGRGNDIYARGLDEILVELKDVTVFRQLAYLAWSSENIDLAWKAIAEWARVVPPDGAAEFWRFIHVKQVFSEEHIKSRQPPGRTFGCILYLLEKSGEREIDPALVRQFQSAYKVYQRDLPPDKISSRVMDIEELGAILVRLDRKTFYEEIVDLTNLVAIQMAVAPGRHSRAHLEPFCREIQALNKPELSNRLIQTLSTVAREKSVETPSFYEKDDAIECLVHVFHDSAAQASLVDFMQIPATTDWHYSGTLPRIAWAAVELSKIIRASGRTMDQVQFNSMWRQDGESDPEFRSRIRKICDELSRAYEEIQKPSGVSKYDETIAWFVFCDEG